MTKTPGRIAGEPVESASASRTIVVIGPLPPPVHGAARVTRASTEVLTRDGWRVTAIDTSVVDGTSRPAYHYRRVRAHLRACAALLRLRRAPQRALYIAGAGGGGLWYQLLVSVLGNLLGFRIVFHHHSFAYILHRALAMRLILRVPLHGGCHIVLCRVMERGLKENYRTTARIEVLSNSDLLGHAPPANLIPGRRHSREHLTFGHLSNLTAEKGLREVLRTLDVLLEARLPVSLMLAGPTKTAEAAGLVAEASVRFGASLTYLGSIPQSAVRDFMTQLDAFLFPSRYRNEADPLVVLEALEAGIPVFAYDVGCLRESIGPMGTVVPSRADFAASVLEATLRTLAEAGSGDQRSRPFARSYQDESARNFRAPHGLTALILGGGPDAT